MNREQDLTAQVYAAQNDRDAADCLLRQYLPFIKSETAKFIHRIPIEGEDDELSIAMFAFHEAVMKYHRSRGGFLHFASVAIKNRLIDYARRERRHSNLVYLDQPEQEGEDSRSMLDRLEDQRNEVQERQDQSAAQKEILEFAGQLADFGLELTDIAENCPRQKRTLEACHRALAFAIAHPELLEKLLSSKKLPISQLASGAGVEVKTLERHRKYMVALLLAYTNGFEIIRGHLRQVAPRKGGRAS